MNLSSNQSPSLKTSIPGSRSQALAARLRKVECRNTTFLSDDFPIFWEKAHGVEVWDVDGNRYLDFTSGFGVAALGYTPDFSVDVLKDQASLLSHAMGDVHPTELKVQLCETLSRSTFESWGAGDGKTILTNSGAEAVEAALKTAWVWGDRLEVIAFENSYHGLTCGALSVTGRSDFRTPFQKELFSKTSFFPYPRFPEDLKDLETSLRRKLSSGQIAAMIVEPILGRGGEVIPPFGFLKLLRLLADEFQVLLIFDEIYVGWYRTGKRFACDHEGVIPDLICLGKAMTGLFPMGACVGKAEIMDRWPLSQGEALHTSTFLGNPLGCRMALAQIERLESLDLDLEKKSRFFHEQIQKLSNAFPGLQFPRARGLLGGVDLIDSQGNPDTSRAIQIMIQSLKSGLILLMSGPSGNVLSLTPPLIMDEKTMAHGFEIIHHQFRKIPQSKAASINPH